MSYGGATASETQSRNGYRDALQKLKDNRRAKSSAQHKPTPSTSQVPYQPPFASQVPPAQSRDATAKTSYYFNPPQASTSGTVLVPNSSSPSHPTQNGSYRSNETPYAPHFATNGAGSSGHHNQGWNGKHALTPDAYNSQTDFARRDATSARPSGQPVKRIRGDGWEEEEDAERPRKRPNPIAGPSSAHDPFQSTAFAMPSSPDGIVAPGQRRRGAPVQAAASPAASEGSPLPNVRDLMNGSDGRARIIRRVSPPSPSFPPSTSATHTSTTPSSSSPANDPQFQRFELTFPTKDRSHKWAAWLAGGRNVAEASKLILDPAWKPPPPTKKVSSAASSVRSAPHGRVENFDAERQAQKQADREKGKKSMIYATQGKLQSRLEDKSDGMKVVDIQSPRAPTPSQIRSSKPIPVAPFLLTPSKPPTRISRSSVVDIDDDSPVKRQTRPQRHVKRRIVVDSEDEDDEDWDDKDDSDHDQRRKAQAKAISYVEERTMQYFNACSPGALQELTGLTPTQTEWVLQQRPFHSVEDLRTRLYQTGGAAGRKKAFQGVTNRLFDEAVRVFEGYGAVDNILTECEQIGSRLQRTFSQWTSKAAANSPKGKGKAVDGIAVDDMEDGALNLHSIADADGRVPSGSGLLTQPPTLGEGVVLKDYQVVGISWLNLLYSEGLSCILADEMGLGKTAQVIAFFAHLHENSIRGPHLVVVPASTLENWCREFERFAPGIIIATYYGDKNSRPELRRTLLDGRIGRGDTWEVLITTYNLVAAGDERDRNFFRKIEWEACVFDEGHSLKNFQSQRYKTLVKIESKWRLLLTGTPLQNNLQELVSLMNFILPEQFTDAVDSLRAIFKVKGDKASLLSQERTSRAKKMMTPFVLRRRKDQVLKDLPKKTERIEWCSLSTLQKTIYNETLQRSRKVILEQEDDEATKREKAEEALLSGRTTKAPKKGKVAVKETRYAENSTNVLMDLRKAASHPLLFRRLFKNDDLRSLAKTLMKEHDFQERNAEYQFVYEDLTVMTDFELQRYVGTYKATRKFQVDNQCYYDSGKITTVLRLIKEYGEDGRRILIFSQFTSLLDILEVVFKQKNIKYLLLTGSTPVDIRQSLVDEFTQDETIPVFLLSTKAGGMGINLTAASAVILFDQDFNPHNDRQAQDRAYRIGQKRDVDVIKLITRGTVEEDMYRLGLTKLALDEAVAGDGEDEKAGGAGGEGAAEKVMKTSLMSALRKQLELEDDGAMVVEDALEGEQKAVEVEVMDTGPVTHLKVDVGEVLGSTKQDDEVVDLLTPLSEDSDMELGE